MAESNSPRAIVIGGGITGLVAAYRLQQAGVRVTLLEKTSRVGGCIRTVRQDGFIMEDGPDSFVAKKPAARLLCEELGLTLQQTLPQPHRAYILRRGELHPLPDGFSGLVPSRLGPVLRTPLLSARGKLRLLMDLVIPPRRSEEDESVASFFRRRIGREAYQELVEPLIGGISGGDPGELSLMAAFPQLREAERQRRGLISILNKKSPGESAFLGISGGMESLPESIAGRLQDVRCHAPVAAVDRVEGAGYRVSLAGGDVLEASWVLMATPASAAAGILRSLDAEIAVLLAAFQYGSVNVVHLAFDARDVARPLDSYGYIVPKTEAQSLVACTWASAKFSGRAPAGKVLFRLFVKSQPNDRPDSGEDTGVLRTAQREIRLTLGISAPPVFGRIHRWQGVMPRYTLGHVARLAKVRRLLRPHPGLILCGALFGGVGISDRVRNAERACGELSSRDGQSGICHKAMV